MRIAVLASGGVDSSVALSLLKREGGHQLQAFYLKIWLEDELSYLGECPWEEDLECVRAVCRQLDVPLEVVSLQREYRSQVVEAAIGELRAGRTPSPDVFCNQRIKFGAFLGRAGEGYEKVATGHYARTRQVDGLHQLLRAPDPVKDQTYFLSHLSQAQLAQAVFPIGAMHKSQVRRLAAHFDLPNQGRKDSQGICFLGKIKYPEFVRHHLGECSGPIHEAETGRLLGRHRGLWFHTIGQRQGLGLHGGPWYVVRKDVEGNALWVSHAEFYRGCARRDLVLSKVNWLSGEPLRQRLQIKLRHGPSLAGCRVRRIDFDRWQVEMDEEDPGVAPGQFGILYDGEVCLGGGVIEE